MNAPVKKPKQYYCLYSTDGSVINKSLKSSNVLVVALNDFQVGAFTYLMDKMTFIMDNEYLVHGLPKYRLHSNRIKTVEAGYQMREVYLGLHPEYITNTSKVLRSMDKNITQKIIIKINDTSNVIYSQASADGGYIYDMLATPVDYDNVARQLVSSLFIAAAKIDRSKPAP